MILFDYDCRDEQSILQYAKQLEGLTIQDVLDEYDKSSQKYYINKYDINYVDKQNKTKEYSVSSNAKGQIGNILEYFYFGYYPNSDQQADFSQAGVELKATCVERKKDDDLRAGERLSITNISFNEPVQENFYQSHLWNKIRLILLIHYLRDKSIDRMDYKILFSNLFTPPKKDLEIIIKDYETINEKIKAGKAHELSESDTLYLGASTKGGKAVNNYREQYYGDHTLARKRNFCFKRQYMEFVLHNYILKDCVPYESISEKRCASDKDLSFEEYIIQCLNTHIGKTDKQLCKEFDREYNNNKAQWSDLTYRMLGIHSNRAEEFVKANIVVKSMRIEKNGKNKESISFPPFKFKEFAQEIWEESTVFEYFDTTRFLFVIYESNGKEYVFKGAKMWNMPYQDLNKTVKDGWNKIHDTVISGVQFGKEKYGKGFRITNTLPKQSDNPIIHIRPHSTKSAYLFKNGNSIGNVDRDANELPDGQWMTTQSFWINHDYMLEQLKITQK